MIVRNKNQRVAVLVDVQNLYYSAKNLYSAKVNFKKLLDICVQDRILTRAIAYVINANPEGGENEFFEAVNTAGFETKEKPLQTFVDGTKKGDWDVGIAMDAVRLSSKVDSIILCSGDGDFLPVVTYLQQSGCLIEIVAFERTANKDLIEMADDFINLEDYGKNVMFRERKSK
ncbi:MAG: NYN domain-containing protein [Candidatus Dojkabacteria bacterium]